MQTSILSLLAGKTLTKTGNNAISGESTDFTSFLNAAVTHDEKTGIPNHPVLSAPSVSKDAAVSTGPKTTAAPTEFPSTVKSVADMDLPETDTSGANAFISLPNSGQLDAAAFGLPPVFDGVSWNPIFAGDLDNAINSFPTSIDPSTQPALPLFEYTNTSSLFGNTIVETAPQIETSIDPAIGRPSDTVLSFPLGGTSVASTTKGNEVPHLNAIPDAPDVHQFANRPSLGSENLQGTLSIQNSDFSPALGFSNFATENNDEVNMGITAPAAADMSLFGRDFENQASVRVLPDASQNQAIASGLAPSTIVKRPSSGAENQQGTLSIRNSGFSPALGLSNLAKENNDELNIGFTAPAAADMSLSGPDFEHQASVRVLPDASQNQAVASVLSATSSRSLFGMNRQEGLPSPLADSALSDADEGAVGTQVAPSDAVQTKPDTSSLMGPLNSGSPGASGSATSAMIQPSPQPQTGSQMAMSNPQLNMAGGSDSIDMTPPDLSGDIDPSLLGELEAEVFKPAEIKSTDTVTQQVNRQTAATHLPAMLSRIGEQILERFTGRSSVFEIRLDPAELGKVDARIEVANDGKIMAVISARDPSVVEALMRGAKTLENALTQAGLTLGEKGVEVQLDQKHSSGADQRQKSSEDQEFGQQNVAESKHEPDVSEQITRMPFTETWSRTRLDVMA